MENRRKNYFIDKKFQRAFILKFCCLIMLGAFMSGVIVYMMSRSTVTTTFENSRLRIKSTAEFILPGVLLSSALVVCVIGAAGAIVTLYTSHRIAGPLYRIEKDIESIAKGDLTAKIRLRETDEIKRLAAALNKMTDNIRQDVAEAKLCAHELEKAKDNKESAKYLEKLKKALNRFNT